MNIFSCYKAKRLSKCFASVLAAVTALTLYIPSVSAASEDTSLGSIALTAEKNAATVSVTCPSAVTQKYSSMQMSFYVENAETDTKFDVKSDLSAAIQQSRFKIEEDKKGTLTVYFSAGTKPLFEKNTITFQLQLNADNKEIKIGVEKDSLIFVNSANSDSYVTMTDGFGYPENMVTLTTVSEETITASSESTIKPPEVTPDISENTTNPPENPVNSSDDSDMQSPVIVVVPSSPQGPQADVTALNAAITNAESYMLAGYDYSEDSYNALVEAVKNAKALLYDTNAVQADIDAAVLNIENAIGMLVHKADAIPDNDQGSGNQNGSVTTTTYLTADSNDINMPTGAETQQQNNDASTLIIIVSVVGIIAAAAVIGVAVMKKKKTD